MTTLDQLLSRMASLGAERFLAKVLSPNDNSKNQFYVGGSSSVFAVLPPVEVKPDTNTKGQGSFKAKLNYFWLDEAGACHQAPHAQLVYYPQYPEVRLSGLLKGSRHAPATLIASRDPGRVLILGIASDRRIFGLVCGPGHPVAREVQAANRAPDEGVFLTLQPRGPEKSPEQQLFAELCRVSHAGWIAGKRLKRNGIVVECHNRQCAGYTLEAELGVAANGYSEPDYLGWEVKAFTVPTIDGDRRAVVTLMTPEPTAGMYVSDGVEAFIRRYGYPDRAGRPDRLNFGGVFRVGRRHELTRLTMVLDGVDARGVVQRTDGYLGLLDDDGNVAAAWSFEGLLAHWNRKHSKAAFVPNMMRQSNGARTYRFGPRVRRAVGTDFSLFVSALHSGSVYYDPGIKLEQASSAAPKPKRRSQFRTSSAHLSELYHSWGVVDACEHGRAHS